MNSNTPEIPACMASEYRTWEEGFDARSESERTGLPVSNPYSGQQAQLWQQGYAVSARVTEIGREAA